MRQEEYLKEFAAESQIEVQLTTAKNSDYAGEKDAFQNFRLIETLSEGNISTEDGILTRMSDKFQRVINLLQRNKQHVSDESVLDTLRDISVYAKILRIYIRYKHDQELQIETAQSKMDIQLKTLEKLSPVLGGPVANSKPR